MNIIVFDNLPSTNTYLKEHYREYPDFTAIRAIHQTEGRGRLGRVFIDDSKQILLSILLKESISPNHMNLVTLFTAQVVHEFLSEYLDNVLIKWPNDLLVNGKKICGILTESIYSEKFEAYIIGIGININSTDFPEPIRDIATSLKLETHQTYEIEMLVNKLTSRFEQSYPLFLKNPVLTTSYQNLHSALINHSVSYQYEGKIIEGTVIEIAENGTLHVLSNQKDYYLNSGEVMLIKTKASIER